MLKRIVITSKAIMRLYFNDDTKYISKMRGLGIVWNNKKKCWEFPAYRYKDIINTLPLDDYDVETINKAINSYLNYENIDYYNDKLFGYQNDAVKFLIKRGSGLICLDMGLGKTRVAIAYAQYLLDNNKINYAIYVTPKSVINGWSEEFRTFNIKPVMIIGNKNKRDKIISDIKDYHILLSYNVLKQDYQKLEKWIKDNDILLVLDEVTKIKSYKSDTYKTVVKVKSKYKVGLTGTPIENDIRELYTINTWLGNRALGNYKTFIAKYSIVDINGKLVSVINTDELKEILNYIYFRRTKVEVFNNINNIKLFEVPVVPNVRELLFYRLVTDMIEENIVDGNYSNVLSYFTMLKLYSDSPILLQLSESSLYKKFVHMCFDEGSKINELMKLLRNINEKLIIFTQYSKMAKIIYSKLKNVYNCYVIDGSTNDKHKIIKEFKKGGDILISTDTLAYGVNMQFCRIVVNYDLPYNPAVVEQRIARVSRIGQKNEVIIYNLIVDCVESVEKRVLEILNNKRKLIGDVI